MMENLDQEQKLLADFRETLIEYAKKISRSMSDYEQITIDYIENELSDLPEDFVGVGVLPSHILYYFMYRVETLLDVMADIEDKYLFKKMLKKLRKIDLTFNNE